MTAQRKARTGAIWLFTTAAWITGFTGNASAEYLEWSALGFRTFTGDPGFEFHDMLVQASGDLYAATPLPDGECVHEFTVSGRDNDPAFDYEAILYRRARTGSVNALSQVMATIVSSGTNALIVNRRDTSILRALINNRLYSYHVVLSLPVGNSIELVSVGVEVEPECLP